MSLTSFPDNEKTPSREDAINQILSSIAMEELGLSNILNCECEKMKYALGTIPGVTGPENPPSIDDLLRLNKSIRETLDSTVQSQMFLKAKMQCAVDASKMCREFLSNYIETLGNGQHVASGANIIFDPESADIVGNYISISDTGETFTITRTGLYSIEWNVNLSSETPPGANVVIGILENGEGASGSASSAPGNFASGTLIYVDTVPFTISLHNYGDDIDLVNPDQWLDSAASIRIFRFADGPSV